MSLIVTGSIGIDSVEAPTGSVENVLGGSTIYFAAAASFFTKPVRALGAVGEDCPEHFFDAFRHFGIDIEGVETRAGSKTFRWRGRYHENMNVRDTLDVQLNVLAEALPPVPAGYADSEYVFLANTDPGSQLDLLTQFRGRKLAIADTMDLWINTQNDKLRELIAAVDGLVLNDSEAISLTGQTNLITAAEAIAAMGPRFVVVKKGEHGCLLLHPDGCVALPAYPARAVVDPTGAGDSFAGGMMGVLADRGDQSLPTFKKALAAGTIVASFNIESFSLERLKQITRADIDQRLRQYGDMLRIDQ
jgi:sugar/nucleoside kinase (ribokinase family)